MKNFYFTFGQGHKDLKGNNMSNTFVKVIAPNYTVARNIFCEEFAEPVMGSPDRWAFQYANKEWVEDNNERFYPDGVHTTLVAPD